MRSRLAHGMDRPSAGTCDKSDPAPCGGGAAGDAPPEARTIAAVAAESARQNLPATIERLRTLCAVDSGTDAPWGRERVTEYLRVWAEAAGCEVERVPTDQGTALVARLRVGAVAGPVDAAAGARTPGPRPPVIALIGHHDTVFRTGEALRCGFAVRDGKVFGPGAADMKGGLVLALEAMASLARRQNLPAFTVELHSVPDEETRTGGAFATLDRLAGARAALVLECARENGDLVVARKSQAHLHMHAEGRSAHSGTEPERGRSALLALAREALRLDALTAARPGLSVTVGTLVAGSSFNSVAGRGEAEIDVRARFAADLDWAIAQIGACGEHDGVEIDLTTISRWPALEEADGACRLFALARSVGHEIGLDLGACRTGGASDGCWTSHAGIPTLDGLGPVGGLDHSPHEYIEADSLPERVGLLAGLIAAIAMEPEGDRGPSAARAAAKSSVK